MTRDLSSMEFLSGSRVYLRPMEPEDLEQVRSWVNSEKTRKLIGSTGPMNREGARAWFERAQNDEHRVWFSVVHREDHRLIGEAGLLKINQAWRSADMTMIIGDPGFRRQGLGTEAAHLLLEYAFDSLNLNRLSVWVASSNTPGLAWWQKIGFKQEGVARQAYFHDGTYHDFVIMGLLKEEWPGGRS